MREFYNLNGDYIPSGYSKSDIYQVPFLINRGTILSGYHQTVGRFVSYKEVSKVYAGLYDLFYQLELMQQRKPEEAKSICKELINLLLKVETDDDTFPIDELVRLYELAGEPKTYDEVGELYLNSIS